MIRVPGTEHDKMAKRKKNRMTETVFFIHVYIKKTEMEIFF